MLSYLDTLGILQQFNIGAQEDIFFILEVFPDTTLPPDIVQVSGHNVIRSSTNIKSVSTLRMLKASVPIVNLYLILENSAPRCLRAKPPNLTPILPHNEGPTKSNSVFFSQTAKWSGYRVPLGSFSFLCSGKYSKYYHIIKKYNINEIFDDIK